MFCRFRKVFFREEYTTQPGALEELPQKTHTRPDAPGACVSFELVGEVGFEPTQAFANEFTVRPF